jgi:hypothetical protein
MRLAYYIAYNPITKSYVGVLKRVYKEKLERLAASLYYDKYKGDFVTKGKVYDPYFSADVLPELIKVFNNRITDTFKYYSSGKAGRSVAFFVVPDRVLSTFPEEFSKYKYVVVVFDTGEIEDLRDAERIYLYDDKQDAVEDYSKYVEELKIIDRYSKGGDSGSPSGSSKVSGTLTRLRSSSLLSKLSRLRRIRESLRRFERSENSWDFLLRGD